MHERAPRAKVLTTYVPAGSAWEDQSAARAALSLGSPGYVVTTAVYDWGRETQVADQDGRVVCEFVEDQQNSVASIVRALQAHDRAVRSGSARPEEMPPARPARTRSSVRRAVRKS